MPLSDTAVWNRDEEKVSITHLPTVSANDLCASLNRIADLAIWKIHTNKLIKKIQVLLNSDKDAYEKFISISPIVEEELSSNRLNNPLSAEFCRLFKKEILDFIWPEIKNTVKKNSTELQARLEDIAKRFTIDNLKASPLRDLLNELKDNSKRCAKRNRCPVPTGVKQLLNVLSSLDWKKDQELPQLLTSCIEIIAERLKYSYLMRDEFTYFLYRNFYSILKEVSGASFEIICRKINFLNKLALQKRKDTNEVFTSLYYFLLEIKETLSSEQWNDKGKILGIFSNKVPDGIYRLKLSFNKLPTSLPLKDEDQIVLIKIFMQINNILFEKVVYSGARPFRVAEVDEFYKDLYRKVQTIYNALSPQDREMFCSVHDEANDLEAKSILAIPKGYALLSNPEYLMRQFKLVSELPNPNPGCSHWA